MFYTIAFIVLYLPVIIFFPTKVIHKERFDRNKKYIIASNHFSNKDCLVYLSKFRRKFRFLGKKELFKTKFTSWLMRNLKVICVDRGGVAPSTFKQILSELNKNNQIFIFPEGTRNKSGTDEMQDAKEGVVIFASKGNAEILPMVIYKKPRLFRKNYIIVGEPYFVKGENPKRLTKEETEENLKIYTEKMESLRAELETYINRKKNKKKKK